jgi:hypothetical protein
MRPWTFVVAALALLACTTPARAQPVSPARAGPYAVELLDERGAPLPTFERRGRTYALGALGQRYSVRVRNGASWRAEVVVSVDGRDVLDGRPASAGKRGYVVEPYGEVTVDGYRLGLDSVATFRFATVPRSYAALEGDARDVGVIGVAVYRERAPQPVAELARPAAPRLDGAAPRGETSAAPAAPAPSAAPGATAKAERAASARPGLGTEFGEERGSRARPVAFQRASRRPEAILTLRYDDRDGLVALGIDVDGARYGRRDDAWLRETAEPFRRDRGFARPPPGWCAR